jgi:type I restriction-modification system DNA methylase subunit
MALFQVSVLNTYLKLQEEQKLANAFKKFSKYFHNPTIQENIRNSKEEQFQATFLTELFVNVLGYTLNPQPDFNLTTEFKNENNARKADGAILKDGAAIGVIELKGTNTKDLEGIRKQAFDYKVNQKSCVYVITSNFEKLRFYINDATEFIEFDLFLLTAKDFALLYICLQKENILKNLPLKIKESSVVKEEQITMDFYKDYSVFKRELYRDLVRLNAKTLKNIRLSDPDFSGVEESNPDYAKSQAQLLRLEKNVKLELFKKSQKLIDRFLFIFFAEDRGLLPPNSTIKIVKDWNKLKELDAVMPLYDRFKLYFSYLDQGRKSTGSRAEIFAYNGGLFKPDNLLDRLEINDELLAKHTTQLSKYNFESQVDVNILGHIFENSLNEIESVNAEIEGADFDKQKSKRKKDGVFYTPKYITKYIVENTLGKLCEEKKTELGFREEEYYKGRKRRQKDTLEALIKILDDYRAWLLKLTICDPACGSGAFLNQALDFLIKEHRYIDELKAKLLGGGLVFSDIETTILENNIYGVDINEESIEIAKLSLWLRTAQPRRKLNDLSNNIKCGNSLIDDKKVAGDKAFNWEDEFKDVFVKGGFDVVIGNPPYVQSHSIDEPTKDFIYKNYESAEYQINTYAIFIEKIFQIISSESVYSIIIPNYWLSTQNDSKLRTLVFLRNKCSEILNVFRVFEDATVDTVILTGTKLAQPQFPHFTKVIAIDGSLKNIKERLLAIDTKLWHTNKTVEFRNIEANTLISFDEKFQLIGKTTLGELFTFKKGMQPYEVGKGIPVQTRELTNARIYHSDERIDSTYKPLLKARNVQRHLIKGTSGFIKYGKNLAAMRNPEIFKGPRILLNRILSGEQLDGVYLEEDNLINNSDIFNLTPKNNSTNVKALYPFIVSRLCALYFKKENINLSRKAFPKINVNTLEKFPIPFINDYQLKILSNCTDIILRNHKNLYSQQQKFELFFIENLQIQKISRKLENWHELKFGEFIKELNKAIKATNKVRTKEGHSPVPELTKKDEFEWMELFEENKKKAVELQLEIEKTEKEIDKMVYELYGLTEEEIAIVEGS